jgi:hypothetical protein
MTLANNTALGQAIIDAGIAEGMPTDLIAQAPKKPTVVNRTRKSDRNNDEQPFIQNVGIGWTHQVATLTVSVDEGKCGYAVNQGPNTWAKLNIKGKPANLNVQMQLTDLGDDVLAYSVHSGDQLRRARDGELPNMLIPVEWNEQEQPNIRKADVDNCDIILMNKRGQFVQLQISVVVRKGVDTEWKMYLQLQELFSGQVVTTKTAHADKHGLTSVKTDKPGVVATVIPLFAHHNRPGTDWLSIKNSETFGPEVLVPTALAEGRTVKLSQAYYEEWEQGEMGTPSEIGRHRGVVQFYNLI